MTSAEVQVNIKLKDISTFVDRMMPDWAEWSPEDRAEALRDELREVLSRAPWERHFGVAVLQEHVTVEAVNPVEVVAGEPLC